MNDVIWTRRYRTNEGKRLHKTLKRFLLREGYVMVANFNVPLDQIVRAIISADDSYRENIERKKVKSALS